MSRSKKRTPVMGIIGNLSEKAFKRNEHQRERTHVRQTLRTTADDTAIAGSKFYGNPWAGPKDGKGYMRDVKGVATLYAELKGNPDDKRAARELHKLIGK